MSLVFRVSGQFTRDERRRGAILVARNAPIFVRRRHQAQFALIAFMVIFAIVLGSDMREGLWWTPIFLAMVIYFYVVHIMPGALQMMPSYPRTFNQYAFEWTETGISRTDAAGIRDDFIWDRKTQKVMITRGFIILFLSPTYSMYIPKRFFTDEQWQQLPIEATSKLPRVKERRGRQFLLWSLLLVAGVVFAKWVQMLLS